MALETWGTETSKCGDYDAGIAEVCLMSGYTVTMYDSKDEFVEKGKNRIDCSFDKLVSKARISESDQKKFMANLLLILKINWGK